jgi:hypothetical protein
LIGGGFVSLSRSEITPSLGSVLFVTLCASETIVLLREELISRVAGRRQQGQHEDQKYILHRSISKLETTPTAKKLAISKRLEKHVCLSRRLELRQKDLYSLMSIPR